MNLLEEKIKSLTPDQRVLFDQILTDNILQICIPTGAGKGYLMMVDLLNQILSTDNRIFTISSHRLMLNNQHLNDIFEILSPVIGDIGFVFIGSSNYDVDKFQDNPEMNTKLLKKGLSYNDIITSTTFTKVVDETINNHLENGRKVVILTTYHSLDKLKNQEIDTIYNDESHTLASDTETAQFKENFSKIKSKRCYFFTATPKDCVDDDTNSFLMNNEDFFGKRIGLTFNECVERGYVVKPVVHIAMPVNYTNDKDLESVENMCKFITDTFKTHKDFITEKSSDPSKISPKVLIKCPSVDTMWEIHKRLVEQNLGFKVCAGASRNPNSMINHFIDNDGIANRNAYLEKLQGFKDDDEVVVLHYDTMSEGINVSGFTATMFLGGKLPTITKTLQNTGRSTRLHPIDRNKLRNGEIKVGDGNWVKPYCAVIIPYWDRESEFSSKELARQIKDLRDNFGFDPSYYISIGDDIAKGKKPEEMDQLNTLGEKNKKVEVIEEIRNEIEILDAEEIDMKERERINSLSDFDFFNEINSVKNP